jgi:hypothetical protein
MLSTDYILLRRLRLKIDLIPGPPHDNETLYNQAIQVIARYPAQQTAAAMGALPNVSVVTDGSLDPRSWQWLWRDGDRSIRFGFSLLEAQLENNMAWGGSTLETDCFVGDLLGLWAQFGRTHPDTWLHYDGLVYTSSGLIDKIRTMIENEVISDII